MCGIGILLGQDKYFPKKSRWNLGMLAQIPGLIHIQDSQIVWLIKMDHLVEGNGKKVNHLDDAVAFGK